MIKAQITESITRQSNRELLNIYVSENKEILYTDGKELFCKICEKSISFDTKYLVNRHLKSKKHQNVSPYKTTETKSESLVEMLTVGELPHYITENTDVLESDGQKLSGKVDMSPISIDDNFLSENQQPETQKQVRSDRRASRKHLSEEKEKLFILEKPQDFCKICLKQFSKAKSMDGKQNITEKPTGCQYNKSIMELLISIQPQIKVEITHNFPTYMCSVCIQNLMISYEFMKMYENSDKKLHEIFKKFDLYEQKIEEMGFDKYGNGIERISNTESSAQKVKYEKDNEPADDECILLLSESTEHESTVFPNKSDDDWTPKKSLKHNPDDNATNKVFEGLFQPEKTDDGSLTSQMCEAVLDGVLPWREHIRQNHLEEKTKRAYHRKTNEPRKSRTPKAHRKSLPNEEGLYQCEYCEKSYPTYLLYRRHLRLHTGTHVMSACVKCGKSFSNITSYNSHMLCHKQDKKFECSQFPKRLECPSDVYGHAMTHINNKPYVCDVCSAAFRLSYQLKMHKRVHTGVKKYKCEYCGKRFRSRSTQVCHIRTHTGEKPFCCRYCEKDFSQSGDCVRHMRKHVGDDNVYMCDLCPLRFPLVRDLRAHFKSHREDDKETLDCNFQARKDAIKYLKINLGPKNCV